MTLVGRTALVTGGGGPLGRAFALALTGAGARVVLVGRGERALADAAEQVAKDGGEARTAVCDVSDPSSVDTLTAELAGEDVSLLVNNAGVAGPVRPLIDIGPDEWDGVFAVNVRGVYLMCRAFLPPMIAAGRGDVVNVASVSGKRPLLNRTPYTASKMALLGLTRTLAGEVGPLGISVNSLSPGPVRGPRMDRNFRLTAELTGCTVEEAERDFASRAALGRLVEEDEVARSLLAMLAMPGLCGADIDLSAGMIAPA
ncbi:NAD(P)-dependent dehydrogenase (short-subunit alcohol dehydrogenase family) [Streptomyces sp. SAI-135]|uniref:SDR family NAD(P)-dependent oxidoreductase n=1 Tax=unclassified Streptomyces TaxID=2593676 RepID=UPI0024733442|nr:MULTISPECIES: SDR family NAD(P)-dependent oxidoreductase [unclassified Streptomyces]MDH6513758.1 NAD(P)-dependent dehydrogenase (short-subunit alcohol dehydrogenase family) [Streptomyces sp. SAI-090]MDH6545931.1 NAD(P)-dependent dehydrogenase (short-subunit alcohol dehydrogenase family) [Streptomyces sp. SAI-041]MDH6622162.1 NAD(P)-dependent dehydrogenase (short-subunit alcohol dehydrogenase family) [Streptomyces sp. SAI-135]